MHTKHFHISTLNRVYIYTFVVFGSLMPYWVELIWVLCAFGVFFALSLFLCSLLLRLLLLLFERIDVRCAHTTIRIGNDDSTLSRVHKQHMDKQHGHIVQCSMPLCYDGFNTHCLCCAVYSLFSFSLRHLLQLRYRICICVCFVIVVVSIILMGISVNLPPSLQSSHSFSLSRSFRSSVVYLFVFCLDVALG